jgi:nucleoside 2-deoxyribosyltransferase
MVREIYIAAPFTEREEAKFIRERLEKMGIISTARWIDSHLEEGVSPEVARVEASADLLDITRADSFLLLNYTSYPCSPGRNIEFGWALAKGKRIFLLGEPSSVFHHHPNIIHIQRVEEIQ